MNGGIWQRMAEDAKYERLPLGGAVSRHSFFALGSYTDLVKMTQRLTERGQRLRTNVAEL